VLKKAFVIITNEGGVLPGKGGPGTGRKRSTQLSDPAPATHSPTPSAETSPAQNRAKAPQKCVGGHRSMAHLKKQILQRVSEQMANK